MSLSRLSTSIADGVLVLPNGKITIMRPAADYDISALPRDDVMIAQGFYPDFASWNDAGYRVTGKAKPADIAIVVGYGVHSLRVCIDACGETQFTMQQTGEANESPDVGKPAWHCSALP